MAKYTIKDVAKLAQVSTATVSRVINGKGNVNPEMEKKVRDAIEKLNYQINVVAKSLKEERTKTVGIIVPDITNPYFMTISKAIEDVLQPLGYQLIFGSSNENPVKEEQLLRLFYGKRVDAIILATAGRNEKAIRKIYEQGIPIILMDRRVNISDVSMHTVEEDNVYGAYILTKRLLELGHRTIGVVNGSLHVSTGYDRYEGFKMALADFGLKEDPFLVYEGDFTTDSGRKAVEYFLHTSQPTAIVSFNNFMTIGVLSELTARDVKVPEEVVVASYDVVEPEELISKKYKLLFIRSAPYAMGRRIGKIIIESLKSENKIELFEEKFKPNFFSYLQ